MHLFPEDKGKDMPYRDTDCKSEYNGAPTVRQSPKVVRPISLKHSRAKVVVIRILPDEPSKQLPKTISWSNCVKTHITDSQGFFHVLGILSYPILSFHIIICPSQSIRILSPSDHESELVS